MAISFSDPPESYLIGDQQLKELRDEIELLCNKNKDLQLQLNEINAYTARIALLEKRVASLEALVLNIGQMLYQQSPPHERDSLDEVRGIWHAERQAAIDAAREG